MSPSSVQPGLFIPCTIFTPQRRPTLMISGGQFRAGRTITWIQVFLLEGGVPPISQALEPQGPHSSPTLGASCPVLQDSNWGQAPCSGDACAGGGTVMKS